MGVGLFGIRERTISRSLFGGVGLEALLAGLVPSGVGHAPWE